MSVLVAYLAISLTNAIATAQTTPICDDIDPSACQLMHARKPDLCSDLSMATSVCPRFCKLCPIECYHCNATVMDYHLCNTTMPCADGQVCMRKELKSYADGHHEYEMTCEDKQLCDGGSGLSIPFGKRSIESRDISITCCADDLCNYPQPTSSTGGCPKDIYFLIDGASSVVNREHLSLLTLLLAIAKGLDIGVTDNLMAVYSYEQAIQKKMGLQQNTDQASLVSDVQYLNLQGFGLRSDTEQAIQNIVNHVLTPQSGDRPAFPDAVVLITDSLTAQKVHLDVRDQYQLKGASHDVIVLSVGPQFNFLGASGENTIATDKNHVLHVDSLRSITSLIDPLMALLKQC